MADERVTLTIEGVEVSVPNGTLVVNAAKQAGIYIPVFCYHPKLDPVGMCRMCLVEIGRPRRDRATGEVLRGEDGEPVIDFTGRLETACTTPVGEGWKVRTTSRTALSGQKEIVEYLLTSHPLDCPICDKGGECPLQELTMDFGSGKSRFLYDDKVDLAKAYPLGDLITLDRERCIQCARCTRFQEEIAGDPVIGFEMRGRQLQIVTYSDPGFDSYFSGNTTDICPVGALTTNDFRFQARPWELNSAASICPHCPVGCNLTLNTRRQAMAGGAVSIQRVMPRQNEAVNEIWICDKGRFAHHYAGSPRRLSKPLIRVEGELVEAGWDEALSRAAEGLKEAGAGLLALGGGRAANEDLFNLHRLAEAMGGKAFLYDDMGGGEFVHAAGLAPGTNLAHLGQGDAILVIASDLHEEAPIWWLRVKQAAERGAAVVVANARPTRLDSFATASLRYPYPQAVEIALGMLHAATKEAELKPYALAKDARKVAAALIEAENLVVFYGQEGLDTAGSTALAQACAAFLDASGHAGRPDNGLVPVWPHANTQGAWDIGLRPAPGGPAAALEGAAAAYIVAADPAGDSPALAGAIEAAGFVVVQELFLTQTAELADVVFPAQSFIEREGTFTTGERRVQRFFPAAPPLGEARPDWSILAQVGQRVEADLEARSAALVFARIAASVPSYAGLSYQRLARSESEWPPVGGDDLYFGGTAYSNRQGLGVQTALSANGREVEAAWPVPPRRAKADGIYVVPVARLFDRSVTVRESDLLGPRLAALRLELNPDDAERLEVMGLPEVELEWDGRTQRVPLAVSSDVPPGAGLLPRSLGASLEYPAFVRVRPVAEG